MPIERYADSPTAPVIHGLQVLGGSPSLPGCSAQRQHSHVVTVSFDVNEEAFAQQPFAAQPSFAANGNVIAHLGSGEHTLYRIVRAGDVLSFTFPDACVAHFNLADGNLAVVTSQAQLPLAHLLVPNTMFSAFLGALGNLVLHASAVSLAGRTLAICGPSHSGKSSLATLATGAGFSIVTDDALRVSHSAGAVWCHPGSPELRLRPTRVWSDLASSQVRALPDDRQGYLPERVVDEQTELVGLVFPTATERPLPALQRKRGEACLRLLLTASRIAWAPSVGVTLLQHLHRLAITIPVYELSVPWSGLARPEVRDAIADQLAQVVDCPPG